MEKMEVQNISSSMNRNQRKFKKKNILLKNYKDDEDTHKWKKGIKAFIHVNQSYKGFYANFCLDINKSFKNVTMKRQESYV